MYNIVDNDDDFSVNSGSIGGESRSGGNESKDKEKAIIPEWLRDERDVCINAHNELLDIYNEIEINLEAHRMRLLEDNYGDEREDYNGRMLIIEQLRNGSISYITYQNEKQAIIEREKIAILKYQELFSEGRNRRNARSNSLVSEIKSLSNNSVSDSIRNKAAKVKDEIFESLQRGSKFVTEGASSLLTKSNSNVSSSYNFGKSKEYDNDGNEIKKKRAKPVTKKVPAAKKKES